MPLHAIVIKEKNKNLDLLLQSKTETENNWALSQKETNLPISSETVELVKKKKIQKFTKFLCEEFTKDHLNFKYCTYYHTFYFYYTEELFWKPLEKIDVHNMIIKWLKNTYK
jgi:hypothetical protein